MTDSLLLPVCLDRITDDATGAPVAGARVFVYDAGTTTLKTVYTGSDLATAAANPIVADAGGWISARYVGIGPYKLVIKDPLGSDDPGDWSTLRTEDDLPGAFNSAPFAVTGARAVMPSIAVATSTYEVAEEDLGSLIVADPTGGTITITLDDPENVDDGSLIAVIHDGSGNDVVVEDDGGTIVTLESQETAVILVSDGTAWRIVATTAEALNANLTALGGVTSAADRLPYFTGSGTADVATFTATARSLLDDASTAAMRTTLELGSMALQAAGSVAITGGTISGGAITGITDLAVADGGTGASSASAALDNFGFTANAKSLVAAADYAAMKTLLGLATADSPQFTGVNVGHASDTTLTRASAGVVAVEGVNLLRASQNLADVSSAATARGNLVAATTAQLELWSFVVEAPADGNYDLVINAPYAVTVNSVTTQCASGSCTLTGKINTTALGGSANSVSTSEQEQAHASSNSLSAGDNFRITVASNSACLKMVVTVKVTRTLA